MIVAGSDPYSTIDDEDIYVAYRRPELVHEDVANPDNDLSEDIRWKLFLARQAALLAYQAKHAERA